MFVWTGEDWDLYQPHRLHYRTAPHEVDRNSRNRERSSVCYGRVLFDEEGEVDDQDWRCVSLRGNGDPTFRDTGVGRHARRTHENDRFIMPMRMSSHCSEERYQMVIDGILSTSALEAAFTEDEKPRCPAAE